MNPNLQADLQLLAEVMADIKLDILTRNVKVCTKCKQLKPWLEYYIVKSDRRAGKPRSRCKTCDKSYREDNVEYFKELGLLLHNKNLLSILVYQYQEICQLLHQYSNLRNQ